MNASTKQRADAFSAQELAAWRGLLEVHSRITHELDGEMRAQHGLSLSAYEVLMFLADAPEHRLRMAEIADRVLVSRSGCTRLVDRLARAGYVSRCAADCDGRGLYATLTDTGLTVVNAARATHRDGVRRHFLEHLGPKDTAALGEILTRLLAARAA